jgi:hypothetical protein
MNLKRGLACMLTFLIVASALMISDGNLVAAPYIPMSVCFSSSGTVVGITCPNPPWPPPETCTSGGSYSYSNTEVNVDIDGATHKYTSNGEGGITIKINGKILTIESVLYGLVFGPLGTVGNFHATWLYEQDFSSPDHTPLTLELVSDWSGTTKVHMESKLTAIGMYTPPYSGTWLLESVHSDAHLQALGIDGIAQLQKVTGAFTETSSDSGFSFVTPEFCYSPAAPVGGTTMYVDKVAVASPYLVLLALMTAVVIVVLARRKPRN